MYTGNRWEILPNQVRWTASFRDGEAFDVAASLTTYLVPIVLTDATAVLAAPTGGPIGTAIIGGTL